jgi:hypothetical protein
METIIVPACGAVVRIWVDGRTTDRAFANIAPSGKEGTRLLVSCIFARLVVYIYDCLVRRSLVFNRHDKYFLTNNIWQITIRRQRTTRLTARKQWQTAGDGKPWAMAWASLASALLSHIGNLPILSVQSLIMCLQFRYCGKHASKSQAVWILPKITTLLDVRQHLLTITFPRENRRAMESCWLGSWFQGPNDAFDGLNRSM